MKGQLELFEQPVAIEPQRTRGTMAALMRSTILAILEYQTKNLSQPEQLSLYDGNLVPEFNFPQPPISRGDDYTSPKAKAPAAPLHRYPAPRFEPQSQPLPPAPTKTPAAVTKNIAVGVLDTDTPTYVQEAAKKLKHFPPRPIEWGAPEGEVPATPLAAEFPAPSGNPVREPATPQAEPFIPLAPPTGAPQAAPEALQQPSVTEFVEGRTLEIAADGTIFEVAKIPVSVLEIANGQAPTGTPEENPAAAAPNVAAVLPPPAPKRTGTLPSPSGSVRAFNAFAPPAPATPPPTAPKAPIVLPPLPPPHPKRSVVLSPPTGMPVPNVMPAAFAPPAGMGFNHVLGVVLPASAPNVVNVRPNRANRKGLKAAAVILFAGALAGAAYLMHRSDTDSFIEKYGKPVPATAPSTTVEITPQTSSPETPAPTTPGTTEVPTVTAETTVPTPATAPVETTLPTTPTTAPAETTVPTPTTTAPVPTPPSSDFPPPVLPTDGMHTPVVPPVAATPEVTVAPDASQPETQTASVVDLHALPYTNAINLGVANPNQFIQTVLDQFNATEHSNFIWNHTDGMFYEHNSTTGWHIMSYSELYQYNLLTQNFVVNGAFLPITA